MFLACRFVYSHTFIPGVPLIHIPSNFQAATMSSPFSINPLMTTRNIPHPVPGFTQFSMVTIQLVGERERERTARKSLWRVHLKVWRIDLTFLMEFEFICIIRYFTQPFVSSLPPRRTDFDRPILWGSIRFFHSPKYYIPLVILSRSVSVRINPPLKLSGPSSFFECVY